MDNLSLVLLVLRGTGFHIFVKHLQEKIEPVAVKQEHATQKICEHWAYYPLPRKIGLHDKQNHVDHVREQHIACVEPDHHVVDEKDGCRFAVLGLGERLHDVGCDVSDVVQVGDDGADFPHVAEVATAEEVEGDNMMKSHLNKVILPCCEEVRDQATDVIALRNQQVFLQLRRVFRIRVLLH